MKIRLKDVIDLEYLIHVDEDAASKEEIISLTKRDREIYSQCKSFAHSRKELLLAWLSIRKKEYLEDKGGKSAFSLPGSSFALVYSIMVYIMVFFGGFTGLVTAYSFLTYHGSRPINVALFIFLFIFLQIILMIASLLLRIGRPSKIPIIHMLISACCFTILPKILNKIRTTSFNKALESLEYTYALIRMKNREYYGLFFWPLFILTSVCAFSFSSGVLSATFFKILISDIAFGWQSTFVSAADSVYEMVSIMAVSWSWFMPIELAHPSLAQIEGSRIVLKDGIHVLATQDLISWWPFICMGLLSYALIPRGMFILAGMFIERRKLQGIDFDHPRFSQLIIRMQSPVLNIDERNTKSRKITGRQPVNELNDTSPYVSEPIGEIVQAVLFVSKNVYSDAAIQQVTQYIKDYLPLAITQIYPIDFDFEKDEEIIANITTKDTKQVIILNEVWQPPIRGILYYFDQIKKKLPDGISVCVLLTGHAGKNDLSVDRDDINFDVWEKAVLKLGEPGIYVKRIVR